MTFKNEKILFKAKTKDTKEWVFSKSIHIVTDNDVKLWVNNKWIDVISESVSRFTGINDKNGNPIFEGDIIRTQPFCDRPYSKTRKSKTFIGEVVYKLRIFRGSIKNPINQVYDAEWDVRIPADFGKYVHFSWSHFYECEIIGHKYDNPELLEVDKNDGTTNV